jgi:hypothetical protein
MPLRLSSRYWYNYGIALLKTESNVVSSKGSEK